MRPKHPNITVDLIGEDGNAFAILGKVSKALFEHAGPEEADAYREEATSRDYDHLLATTQEWVNVA